MLGKSSTSELLPIFLTQSFTLQPRLASNSKSYCLSFLHAGITGVQQHTRLQFSLQLSVPLNMLQITSSYYTCKVLRTSVQTSSCQATTLNPSKDHLLSWQHSLLMKPKSPSLDKTSFLSIRNLLQLSLRLQAHQTCWVLCLSPQPLRFSFQLVCPTYLLQKFKSSSNSSFPSLSHWLPIQLQKFLKSASLFNLYCLCLCTSLCNLRLIREGNTSPHKCFSLP